MPWGLSCTPRGVLQGCAKTARRSLQAVTRANICEQSCVRGQVTSGGQAGGLVAALGAMWAHAVNTRLVLESRGPTRYVKVRALRPVRPRCGLLCFFIVATSTTRVWSRIDSLSFALGSSRSHTAPASVQALPAAVTQERA